MYHGLFRIKNSPYPDMLLKDWMATPSNISFLENRLAYFLDDNCQISPPAAYLQGLEYKIKAMKKQLSEQFATL